MGEVLPITTGQAERKRQLISTSLFQCRTAGEIDERDDEMLVAEWLSWYDASVGDMQNIEIVAGAMRIEMLRRKGERVIAEGELRGAHFSEKRRHPEASKTKADNPAHLVRKSRPKDRYIARVIASEPEAVKEYVRNTIAAGCAPNVSGALIAARKSWGLQAQSDCIPQVEGIGSLIEALDKLADCKPHQLVRLGTGVMPPGMSLHLGTIRALGLIPWLRIERHATDSATFHVDAELRASCEARSPRPQLNGWSMQAWTKNLREQITARRNANHDDWMKKRWQPDDVVKRQQPELLDWIGAELDKVL